MEPSREPSAARARGREALLAAQGSAVGAGRAGEFFEALGPAWRLTAAQWARLTPAVLALWMMARHHTGWPGSPG